MIRDYGGDLLVVGFLFWLILAVAPRLTPYKVALPVFVFALIIEVFQLFELRPLRAALGDPLSTLILGQSFDWLDLAAYAVGLTLCLPLARISVGRWDEGAL